MVASNRSPEDEELGVLLRAAMTSYHASLASALDGFEPMVRGYLVLSLVANNETPSQLEIARKLGVAKNVVTYMLDDLEQRGLVKRLPDNEDRRRWRIALTTDGKKQFAALEKNVREVEATIFAAMTPEEIDSMKLSLSKVSDTQPPGEVVCTDPPPQ